ncbi:17.4 kDa class III heat shock protein [Apium graveolens]|uniref:17.4 kDa class III heat shock protein n=1 Tax=Apium graveolens TaxID=4045 RepID=UPI003D796DBE
MAGYLNGDVATAALSQLLNLPEAVDKLISPSRSRDSRAAFDSIPVDILETSDHYIFHMDVPGLSKSDIQVTVEDGNTLVIQSNGKRKREDGEQECKYLKLERKLPQKLARKFRLPENCNASGISAKCENGVLTVSIEKLPPPKSKSVSIAIS